METFNNVYTPYIGANGNWYINNEDTGVKAQGTTGPQGPVGPSGQSGAQGLIGLKGENGDRGPQGIQGPTGATGSQGLKGDKGDKGETGLQGEKGDTPDLIADLQTTVVGKALDATMGKTLDDKIVDVNRKLNSRLGGDCTGTALKGSKFSNNVAYIVKNGWCFVTMETTPSVAVTNHDVVCTGLPNPPRVIYLSLTTGGGNYTASILGDGTLEIYFPSFTTASRIDCSFVYPVA